MKKLGVSFLTASLISSSLWAQAADEATNAASLPSEIEFSGAISTGMRNYTEGTTDDDKVKSVVGPFLQPTLSLGYEVSKFSLNVGYEFEAFGGQGFGSGFGEISKSFGDNAYFNHKPTISFSGNISSRVSLATYAEYWIVNNSDNQAENSREFYIEPNLKVKLTDNFTAGIGYHYLRAESPDGLGLGSDSDVLSGFASTDKDTVKDSRNSMNRAFITGVSQRHAGRVLTEVKISDSTSLNTYVHAGQIITQDNSNKYTYRLNSDLSTKPVKDLNLGFRYRFNIDDSKNSPALKWYNLVRIDAEYAVTDSWALVTGNEIIFTQLANTFDPDNNNQPVSDKYSSENYLGVSYKF